MTATRSSWDPDIVLDSEIVQALLEIQFPALKIESIRFLDQGWDNAAFQINDEWVFRFPKRREREEWLISEIAVLELLRTCEFPITIPVSEFFGHAGIKYSCRFFGYQMIAGKQADNTPTKRVSWKDSARRIGELLTVLHSVDVHSAQKRGVKSYEWPLTDEFAEANSMKELVFSHLPPALKEPCRQFLHGSGKLPQNCPPRRCLVHGDLEDEHILLDENGRIAGVIDWGDAGLSDPTIDFRGIYCWLGEEFVCNVLEHYRHPYESSFMDQIAFRARCNSLMTFGYSLSGHHTVASDRLRMVYSAFGVKSDQDDRRNEMEVL